MNFDQLIHQLKLDKEEFYFQFNSHPDYPSALALSDTLDFFRIENDAYEIEEDIWGELPDKYVAIVKQDGQGKFTLVQRTKDGYDLFSDKKYHYSEKEFLENVGNFVLIMNDQHQEKSDKIEKKNIFYILIGLFLLISLPFNTLWSNAFNVLSVIGIMLSYELFFQDLGQTSAIISNICGGGAGQGPDVRSSCDKVIGSGTFSLFGLKLQDYSFIYFLSLFFIGILIPFSGTVLFVFSTISLFVVVYSLYMQSVVLKAFCKVCLFIAAILIGQFVLSLLKLNEGYHIYPFLISLVFMGGIFGLVYYLKNLNLKYDELKKNHMKNIRFKRNFQLFKRELEAEEPISFENPKELFFVGNPGSKLHMAIISNPYCGFCKGGHEIIQKLLDKSEDISVQIRFNYRDFRADENFKKLLSKLYEIYLKDQKEFLNALHFWFEKRDHDVFFKTYGEAEINQPFLHALEIQTLENDKHSLNFTPIFIVNKYKYPSVYEREDIYYFIDDLMEEQ
ncbi:vitamin K epoxide reductase family protein [Elizabethkingia miricola]|uniref:vitamin K epoxide reductase family protein n=1 Tax=Elizabethkingia miricola TaxID=172045 RepID=UPI000998FE74|nr:vitamin K epoxide reductase family protein [Elizabethkingia miricola]OPC14010.1 vitamin K epoxide reductase [Elizabethkingia miricola]